MLFSFVVYLLYLRFFHLVRYLNISTNLLINFNFYLTISYVIAFLLSLGITIFMYTAQITGVALAHILMDLSPVGPNPPILVGTEILSEVTPPKDVEPADT